LPEPNSEFGLLKLTRFSLYVTPGCAFQTAKWNQCVELLLADLRKEENKGQRSSHSCSHACMQRHERTTTLIDHWLRMTCQEIAGYKQLMCTPVAFSGVIARPLPVKWVHALHAVEQQLSVVLSNYSICNPVVLTAAAEGILLLLLWHSLTTHLSFQSLVMNRSYSLSQTCTAILKLPPSNCESNCSTPGVILLQGS
jgi:hypothetical protein